MTSILTSSQVNKTYLFLYFYSELGRLCHTGVNHECEEFVEVCLRSKFQEWSPKGHGNCRYSSQSQWAYFQEQEDFRDKAFLSIVLGFAGKECYQTVRERILRWCWLMCISCCCGWTSHNHTFLCWASFSALQKQPLKPDISRLEGQGNDWCLKSLLCSPFTLLCW